MRGRLLDASLRCVAARGVRGTTLADVAAEAPCARATLYRCFPGGRAGLFQALGERELGRFVDAVCEPLAGALDTEDALTTVLCGAARALQEHTAFQYVFRNEPDVLLPYLGFKQVDRLYRAVSVLAGPHLAPFVGQDQAGWAAEWLARTVTSYVFFASGDVDLTDADQARTLVRRFLLPALDPAAAGADEGRDRPSHRRASMQPTLQGS